MACVVPVAGVSSAVKRVSGFTLLEMLVVIVLAGILLSVVTISVAPDPRQQLKREAQRVGQLVALAADEVRIRQQSVVWEADLNGYRFVTESGGERQLLMHDDLLRERRWEQPMQRLVVFDDAGKPAQSLLGPGAPAVRVPVTREWIQPRWQLELVNDHASVLITFDEKGQAVLESSVLESR